jgi:hypothetical protein
MRIDITQTVKGSPNGIIVMEYAPGVQEVPDDLARVFIDMNVARKLSAPRPTPTPTKAKAKAPNARTGKV